MKVTLSLLVFTFVLIGCSSNEEKDFKVASSLFDELAIIENDVSDKWESYSGLVESYETEETTTDQAYKAFDELKAELGELSIKVEELPIEDEATEETKQELEKIKTEYSGAIFELAKMAGYYRNYVSSGDESNLEKISQRRKAYGEDQQEIEKMSNDLLNKLGYE